MITGPPPKPTALKLLEGNPGKRPLNMDDPSTKLEIKIPDPPDYLDEAAQAEWNRIAPLLLQMRLLTDADQHMLASWCTQVGILSDALKQMKKAGTLFKTPSGYIQQSPLLGIVNNATQQLHRIAAEFGLSPSSRVRLHAAPEAEKAGGKWAKFKKTS